MKVLIYGHRGWIGGLFIEQLKKQEPKTTILLGTSRVDNVEMVRKEILSNIPTHIVCLIGRTHGEKFPTIDYLEQPGKLVENVRDNLFSPIVLALICKEYSIHLTYFGTGCIFIYDEQKPCYPAGDERNGFKEEDNANFFGSSYSVVKGFTDQLMKYFFKTNVLQLRIRMPISSQRNPRNFITKITTYDKICSIPNSMTVLDDLLPIAIDMMKSCTTGTFNFTNPGVISHNEILQLYKDIVDPKFQWKNFTLEEQEKILKAGRSNNYLNTDLLTSLYYVPPIKEGVKMALHRMKNNNFNY